MHQAIENSMVSLYEHDIMLDSTLRIPSEHLVDDISNDTMGFCFLEDRRNALVGCSHALASHILDTPSLKAKFTECRDGMLSWSRTALLKWLSCYQTLSKHHLLRCELAAGGPSRGTELTAMMYRSSQGRGLRNLVILDRHVVLVRAYSKTSAMLANDRVIPHSLDSFQSDLLIQDLALARPFALFAIHTCFPDRSDLIHLYQYHLFVNFTTLFDTEDLSGLMGTYTSTYLYTHLTVRPWRHISIAWRRKFCPNNPEFHDEANLQDHIGAEQTGHSARLESMHYAISATALAGPSEDILPLYLKASGNWQQVFGIVPGNVPSAACSSSRSQSIKVDSASITSRL